MKALTTEEFIRRAKEVHGSVFDYSKAVFTGYQKKIEIICLVHGSFWQNANDHLSRAPGKGCPYCYNEQRGSNRRMSFQEFVSRSSLIHNNKYQYIEPPEWKNLHSLKIDIVCPIHGTFTQRVSDHLYLACGCPTCCESQGERFVENYLTELGLSFEREKTFDWLINSKTGKQLPLDFYIDSLKLAIEVDGGQHRYPVEHFGGIKAFEKNQYKDLLRENLCRIHDITLIRIFYSDRRELNKTLSELQVKMKEFKIEGI